MSETVKLIIEIPKEMMKALEVGNFGSKYNPYDVCWRVRNGTPLDDVKAEIAKPIQEECCYIGAARIQADTIKWCLEIIDNIGKAESEDFPQAKDIEPTVKGFVDTMDILDNIIGKESEE